jgi:hypothetical protein
MTGPLLGTPETTDQLYAWRLTFATAPASYQAIAHRGDRLGSRQYASFNGASVRSTSTVDITSTFVGPNRVSAMLLLAPCMLEMVDLEMAICMRWGTTMIWLLLYLTSRLNHGQGSGLCYRSVCILLRTVPSLLGLILCVLVFGLHI